MTLVIVLTLDYIFEEIIFFKFIKNIHIKDRILNSISVPLGKGDFNLEVFIIFKKL